MKLEDPISRFWKYALIVPFCECWEWIGCKAVNGYGVIRSRGKNYLAHRFSYEISVGPIADGMMIDHKCRNRACVNPSHLRQVTHFQNNVENSVSMSAKNKQKTHCKRGHEFNEVNTYFRKSGARFCRPCGAIYQNARNAKLKSISTG